MMQTSGPVWDTGVSLTTKGHPYYSFEHYSEGCALLCCWEVK